MACHRICALLALAQTFSVFGVRQRRPRSAVANFTGYQVVKATPKTDAQLKALDEDVIKSNGINVDMWSHPYKIGDPVTLMFCDKTAAKAMNYLKSHKIAFKNTITNVQSAIEATLPGPSIMSGAFSYDQFHTMDEIDDWITDFGQKHSKVDIFSIGKTGEGRTVNALKINAGSNKPIVILVCGVHSREWISPATCLITANDIVQGNVGSDYDAFEWHIVPVANKDGYVYTWTSNRMWRKTRAKAESWWCGDGGVDPNRNWDFNHCMKSQERICRQDAYCGKEAFSESEATNLAYHVRDLIEEGRDVRAFLDIHAFSEMWLWPWGYTSELPKDVKAMAKCGNAAADATSKVAGRPWRRGTIASTIYTCGGTSLDWLYHTYGLKYVYALELRDTGDYGFLLPPNQIVPGAKEFMAGLDAMVTCIAENP